MGAVVPAFGVGELWALNAIGGAYAEMAPVVHIVGTPPVSLQNGGACMHHSLGEGKFRVFADMAAKGHRAQTNPDPPDPSPRRDHPARPHILFDAPPLL